MCNTALISILDFFCKLLGPQFPLHLHTAFTNHVDMLLSERPRSLPSSRKCRTLRLPYRSCFRVPTAAKDEDLEFGHCHESKCQSIACNEAVGNNKRLPTTAFQPNVCESPRRIIYVNLHIPRVPVRHSLKHDLSLKLVTMLLHERLGQCLMNR